MGDADLLSVDDVLSFKKKVLLVVCLSTLSRLISMILAVGQGY
jgi:hypothetical protein